MSVQTFWSEARWGLKFGAWGKDYTIVKAPHGGGYHVGFDIQSAGDIPCLIGGGVVTVLKTGTMGYCVEIDTGAARAGQGRYFTYCHIAGDNVPRVGDKVAAGGRVGRTARGPRGIAYTSVEFPGTAWYGIHCHLVVSDIIHAAWTTVKGRTLSAFYDPAPIIRSVLSNHAGGDAKPFPIIPKEWDEMATKQEIKDAVREVLADATGPKPSGYTWLRMFDDGGIYIASTITGRIAQIATPAHVQMLQRFKTDNSLVNQAEASICRGYITAVNPPAGVNVDTDVLAAKLAELSAKTDADTIRAAVSSAINGATIRVAG